mgnify:FL=1|jgi:repressor LexA
MRKDIMTVNKGIGKGITSKFGLTKKQAKFLEVLRGFIKQNGYSPSFEEMKQLNGMKSKDNVYQYVNNLKKRGYVDFQKYLKRTVVVL